MPLTVEQDELLTRCYQALERPAIEPDDPLYEPVYETMGAEDPVRMLTAAIRRAHTESIQMFSGFRGSGKTTQLFRLRDSLQDAGFTVLYADALDYVNPSEPLDIAALLLVIAGAFSDSLEREIGVDLAGESYWRRLVNYLNRTEVTVDSAGFKLEGIDFKAALRTTPSFKQQLHKVLSGRLAEVKRDVDQFIEEGVKKIRAKSGDSRRIVFLFDSLEQIRGSIFTETDVIRSVQQVFANHLRLLELPYVHVVYTVPPWLQFVMPNTAPVTLLPSIRQWNNDPPRTPHEPGWSVLRGVIGRRLTAEGQGKLFAHPGQLEQLLSVCGGHFRDLFRLVRALILRLDDLPATDQAVESAISSVREQFLPIAVEDARWLHRIGQTRRDPLPSPEPRTVSRLTRFLDTHFVLFIKNGEPWYDLHPLIRDEAAGIVSRNPEPAD
ncbi:MAG: hypothetical protein FJW39_12115 [Acidobacteria bacterium]|nr:hypothetical protein [Acidobacteriota bacterium]